MELGKDYEIIKILGSGTIGKTVLARILDDHYMKEWYCNEYIVIKYAQGEMVERALGNEIKYNNALQIFCSKGEMEYLCEVYSVNILKERSEIKLGLIMEYMPEGNLRDKMKRKQITAENVISYIKDILKGVCILHKNKIIHRDIKPENILFKNNKPRITDFGKGPIINSLLVGKLIYTSPEFLTGNKISYYSDIFTLGIIFYEMLYGCLPFEIKSECSDVQIIYSILNNDLKFSENNNVHDQLKLIITKALEKNPEKRYQTAQEMLDDIELVDTKNYQNLIKSH